MAINKKGFILDAQNNILLPLTRGELVCDANGNIALHSSVFKAVRSVNGIGGKYGLMSPEDLALIDEAIARIVALETLIGQATGDDDILALLAQLKSDLIDIRTEIGAKADPTNSTESTGIYKYVDDKFKEAISGAVSDAVNPLRFKGVIEANNITSLDEENISVGDVYKASKVGTINGTSVNVGDLIIRSDSGWEIVPSGDDVSTLLYLSDTPLAGNIKLEGDSVIGITYDNTTGTIKFAANLTGLGGDFVDLQSALTALAGRVATLEGIILNPVTQISEIVDETIEDDNTVYPNDGRLVSAKSIRELIDAWNILAATHLTAVEFELEDTITSISFDGADIALKDLVGGTIN